MANNKGAADPGNEEELAELVGAPTRDLSEVEIGKIKANGEQTGEAKPPATAARKDPAAEANATVKWAVLAFLVVQNSSASLLMRYSRAQPGEGQWNTQTGVILQEVVKGLVCILLLAREGTLATAFSDRQEALKTGIPAVIYLVQNNLQYAAINYLDASTYAVLYQLKIVSTALLSVLLLHKQLKVTQWAALTLLTVGVAMVVVAQMSPSATSGQEGKSIVPGLVAVLMACFFSGLAGVSFEKLLKGSTVSLWARNLQMAIYSMIIGVGNLYWEQRDFSISEDFFKGYTTAAWLAILNNAFGGLLIAAVIKYADNIMKNFSTSLSIVLTAMVSVLVFGSMLNALFCVGTALVLYAVPLYGGVNPMELLKRLIMSDNKM